MKMNNLIRICLLVIAALAIITGINYGYALWSIRHWEKIFEHSSFEQLKKEYPAYYYETDTEPREQLVVYQEKQLIPNFFFHDFVIIKSSLSGMSIHDRGFLKSTSREVMEAKIKSFQEDGFKEEENVSSVGEIISSSLKMAGFKEHGT